MQKESQEEQKPLQVTEISAIIETKKFVSEFGVETLMELFSQFRDSVSCKDYRMFHRIKDTTCEVFEVSPRSVFVIKKGDYIVAKNVIAYLLRHYTSFKQDVISSKIGISVANTSRAIGLIDHYRNHPSQFRDICEKIDRVESKISLPKELSTLKLG